VSLPQFLTQSDAIGQAVALLLLVMSIASWVVILWKAWILRRAASGVARGMAAFWAAPSLEQASRQVAGADASGLVLPLVQASAMPAGGTLASAGERAEQLTRTLRGALHAASARLQFGQVLLATTGAIAPFVGLLGTVWAIYQISIERVAGPVGEALIMTAAGLAVAIPAVLAYNGFGRTIGRVEAELEGFAHDLRELLARSDHV